MNIIKFPNILKNQETNESESIKKNTKPVRPHFLTPPGTFRVQKSFLQKAVFSLIISQLNRLEGKQKSLSSNTGKLNLVENNVH